MVKNEISSDKNCREAFSETALLWVNSAQSDIIVFSEKLANSVFAECAKRYTGALGDHK